jgi:catechol 2,3-dioxygenase-like lactoylglutathione lyase family enzyme
MISLDTIDHIAITVNNIKEAVAWYREHFKCAVVYQDESWAYLEFANIRLAMVVASEHPSHIRFAVENASKYGVLTTHRDGTRSVYVRDPAGNTVEMVDKICDG